MRPLSGSAAGHAGRCSTRRARTGCMKSSSTATGCSVLSRAEQRAAHAQRQGLDGKFSLALERLQKLKAKTPCWTWKPSILDAEGKSSFQALQAALGERGNPEEIVAYVFDLLHLDGKDLTRLPLIERKEKLENAAEEIETGSLLRYSEHVAGRWRGDVRQSLRDGTWRASSPSAADAPYVAGPSEKLAENQMRPAAGIHHPWLQRRTKGERALGALYLGYQEGRRPAVMRGRSAPASTMKSARELAERFAGMAVEKPS